MTTSGRGSTVKVQTDLALVPFLDTAKACDAFMSPIFNSCSRKISVEAFIMLIMTGSLSYFWKCLT